MRADAQSRGLDANADADPGDTRRTHCFYRNGGIALFMGFYGRHGTRRTLSQQARSWSRAAVLKSARRLFKLGLDKANTRNGQLSPLRASWRLFRIGYKQLMGGG